MRICYRPLRRREAAAVLALTLGTLLLSALFLAALQLRPILESMAVTRASNTVNRIVSQAVNEAIDSGEISYERLISFEKGSDGRITAVHSNMAAFNRLQSSILDLVLTRIEQVPTRELSIPIGTLTGAALLAGRGPCIRVRMESLGSSSAWFQNDFSSAGINQTKHQIVLNIDVYVTVLLPGFTTATKVSNAITVAETIIVGMVPESYTYFNARPDHSEQDLQDYMMNQS